MRKRYVLASLLVVFSVHALDTKLVTGARPELGKKAARLVGDWWSPCDSAIALRANGTGTQMLVGPVGPTTDKPETFRWHVKDNRLIRRFTDREESHVITEITGKRVDLKGKDGRWTWQRRRKE
jgi:hypothetical protein